MSVKILGQQAPSATSETTLYTCPSSNVAVGNLVVCSRDGTYSDTFRVSVSVGGGATATKDYLFYDYPIEASSSQIHKLGICLVATDVVRVYASTANLSFGLFGQESAVLSSVKTLGQSAPSATTETDLYTCPASNQASVSTLVVCNRDTSGTTFRVSVSSNGAATTTKDYLYYDVPIGAKDTLRLPLGACVDASDKVRVYAGTANLSFNLFGEEWAA